MATWKLHCHRRRLCVTPLILVKRQKYIVKRILLALASWPVGGVSLVHWHLHLHHLIWSSISNLVIIAIRLSRCLLLCQERFKIGVVESPLGRNSPRRVVDQHHLEQFETVVVKRAAERIAIITLPLGEGCFEVRVRCDTWPDLFGGRTKSAKELLAV